jgi:hypothetical protein
MRGGIPSGVLTKQDVFWIDAAADGRRVWDTVAPNRRLVERDGWSCAWGVTQPL